MTIEQVPMFFVKDDEIKDVRYVEFDDEKPEGLSVPLEGVKYGVTEDTDRVIFETPRGCFELDILMHMGDTLHLLQGRGVGMKECTRKAHFAIPEAVVPNDLSQT